MKRSPLRRRSPLRHGGILRPVVRLPRRTSREEAKLYRELRKLVHAREGGRCASCGTVTPLSEGECHHRKLRSRGGPNTAFNCVWLCSACHTAAHRDLAGAATRAGLLVPSWADEHTWPVSQPCGRDGWWQPTPDGWVAAEPTVDQRWHRLPVTSQEVTR